MPSPPSPRAVGQSRKTRRVWTWLAVGSAALVSVLLLALYAQRGAIGARVAEDYLRRRGVPARIEVQRLWSDGFTARVRLGPADDPDFTAERAEVAFMPLRGLATPVVRSIRLVHPALKLRLDGARFDFGSLQPLVTEALARPGKGPAPDVTVEDGRVAVLTPAGTLHLSTDAKLARGRLERLMVGMAPGALAQGAGEAVVRGARLSLSGSGPRLEGRFAGELSKAAWGAVQARDFSVQGAFNLSYPEGGQPGLEGPLGFALRLRASAARSGRQSLVALDARLNFSGEGHGPLDHLALRGAARIAAAAGEARTRGLVATRLGVAGDLHDLRISRTRAGIAGRAQAALTMNGAQVQAGPGRAKGLRLAARSSALAFAAGQVWAVQGPVEGEVGAARWTRPLARGALSLQPLSLVFRGRGSAGPGGAAGAFTGRVAAQGGLSPDAALQLAEAVPLLGTDPPSRTALAAALRAARVEAPDIALTLSPRATRLALNAPLRLATDSGARLTLSSTAAPLAQRTGQGTTGGFRLALAGGRLPAMDLDIDGYRLGPAGLAAAGGLRLAGDLGPLRGARVAVRGQLSERGRAVDFTAAECARVALAALLSEGKPSIERVSARLCPQPRLPLLAISPAGWRFGARAEAAAVHVPLLLADFRDVSGRVVGERRAGSAPTVTAEIARAEVTDAGPQRRFRPLLASGRAVLAGERWQGAFSLAEARRGAPLGSVTLRHDAPLGQGGAEVHAPGLSFARGGLQPTDVSPLLAALGSEVVGRAAFDGRLGWSRAGLTSSGRFSTEGLDFKSSFGRVTQARMVVTLTSLAPFVSAPDQRLAARHVDWIVPLDDLEATYAVTPSAVNLASARARVAKGAVSLDALAFPFKQGQTLKGVIHLKDVDLAALFASVGLGDAVAAQARIDGVLPFSAGTQGLRFYKGRVYATGPGRLSVSRQALTATAASPAGGAAAPTAVQDFAYQALENLAFDQLEAQVDSRPGGRLGVLFHVKGRHDPPRAPPTRIGLLEALSGRAFAKPIPLPKGTPIDLTLDTSLNFDDLLMQFRALNAHSAAVQP